MKVFVTFLYWDTIWDDWISDIDRRIAPLHTHTYTEGGTLRLGQRVEALDKTNKWLEAFVIETSQDQVKVHYKGWHEKFDEWLNRKGTRIRPYGRHKSIVQKKRREQKLWKVPGYPTTSTGSVSSVAQHKLVPTGTSPMHTTSRKDDTQHQRQIVELSDR